MPGSPHIWSPDDWEVYCDGLFRERHGPTGYVKVPDRDRGDLGMRPQRSASATSSSATR
jgi:hypothetical protein